MALMSVPAGVWSERFDDPLYLNGLAAMLAGPANVIMQLALAPVGYGVLESKVDGGKVTVHPIKRFRTTFTYLAVAMRGTEAECRTYREAVDTSHRLVRSDEQSPVKYNAFDRDLQLWVAACLYYGTVDVYEKFYGPMPEHTADALYRHAARFGTTLQMPQEMWPADRAGFERYWQQSLARVHIDGPVRRYLRDLVTREHMSRMLRGSSRFNVWVTTGFLPQRFRDEMQLPWTPNDQQRFELVMRRLGAVHRRLPRVIRQFPINWMLADLRLRIRFGRRLV
jgi:uncharacterized protein (DUF2236 family)